jgi:hypothetical protein
MVYSSRPSRVSALQEVTQGGGAVLFVVGGKDERDETSAGQFAEALRGGARAQSPPINLPVGDLDPSGIDDLTSG